MDSIKFSISVPVYKQAHFLRTALESLRHQTVPFELAVLDATPDDSGQAVLHDYQDMITYQYHHADAGQAAAIQAGWDNTAGNVVAWLNADDYYFPDTLTKVAAIFQANPAVDIVYGHAVFVEPENKFQMYFPAISTNAALLTKNNIICQPSCFVRRTALERVKGLNTALHYVMDWDLWVRLYNANCHFYFLDEVLSVVRMYPETKTLSGANKRQQEIMALLKKNGANWLRCQTAALSFIFHAAIKNRKSLLGCMVRVILNYLHRLHKKGGVNIRGITSWTNQVDTAGCEVLLPWYGADGEHVVNIITDDIMKPNLFFNGQEIFVTAQGNKEVVFFHKKIKVYLYQAIVFNKQNNVLKFVLHSAQNPWRLLSLVVQ
jgi:glycosyltransferase involved in cell wall biosynthesis